MYRAPEVILKNLCWNMSSDIWSMACILSELYMGELLFDTEEDIEHLAMIEK
jgi:dual-specificity kinase